MVTAGELAVHVAYRMLVRSPWPTSTVERRIGDGAWCAVGTFADAATAQRAMRSAMARDREAASRLGVEVWTEVDDQPWGDVILALPLTWIATELRRLADAAESVAIDVERIEYNTREAP